CHPQERGRFGRTRKVAPATGSVAIEQAARAASSAARGEGLSRIVEEAERLVPALVAIGDNDPLDAEASRAVECAPDALAVGLRVDAADVEGVRVTAGPLPGAPGAA